MKQVAGHVWVRKRPAGPQCSSLREVPRALVDQPSLELGDAGEHRQRKDETSEPPMSLEINRSDA